MNQSSDRISCPKCQAANFASSAVCWQCGEPLPRSQVQAENETPGEPTPPPSSPPPYEPMAPPPPLPPRATDEGQAYVIWGFVLAALGVFCCPCIFGVAAIVLGVIANSKGNKMGVWVIVAGVASLVLGTIIGVVFNAALQPYLRNLPNSPYMRPS